jgi:hypothetical protein
MHRSPSIRRARLVGDALAAALGGVALPAAASAHDPNAPVGPNPGFRKPAGPDHVLCGYIIEPPRP